MMLCVSKSLSKAGTRWFYSFPLSQLAVDRVRFFTHHAGATANKSLVLSPSFALSMTSHCQPSRPLTSTAAMFGGEEGAPHFKRSSVKHPLSNAIPNTQAQPMDSSSKLTSDFHGSSDSDVPSSYSLPHPIWSKEETENVQITHTPPVSKVDKAAYLSIRVLRAVFDIFSGYGWGKWMGTLDERKWLSRFIFLETVAGVPGMIGATTRHFKSLRYMTRDHGWIHTLLEEAENERMHLLTFMELRKPGRLFKTMVVAGQGVFVTMFWIAYMISARFCHRFVGYLEEEAVVTYTHCIKSIDNGDLPMWAKLPAPPIAVKYWRLCEDALMRDVLMAIRADEAHHRVVNHTLSSMKPSEHNPYGPGR